MRINVQKAADQNTDGTPHFTYYIKEDLLSFIWDGKSTYIEVCHGGYGEPVTDTISVYPPGRMTPAAALAWFQEICDHYWEGY